MAPDIFVGVLTHTLSRELAGAEERVAQVHVWVLLAYAESS
jgi:hypothetical protein